MYKPFINHALKLISTWLATTLMITPALAAESDFKEQIKVRSEQQFLDGKNKTMVFRGQVKIMQGSLNIGAERLEVFANNGKGNEVYIATGNPATYSQTKADGTRISAKANKIEYTQGKRLLTLTGNAEAQQDGSLVKGQSIVFNMVNEQLMAQGTEQDGGLTTTIIQLDNSDEQTQQEQQP